MNDTIDDFLSWCEHEWKSHKEAHDNRDDEGDASHYYRAKDVEKAMQVVQEYRMRTGIKVGSTVEKSC